MQDINHKNISIAGKFKPDSEGSVNDPKTWKATFRCALNSLPDVTEVKEMSEKKGPTAYKVYQFLEPKKNRRPRKTIVGKGELCIMLWLPMD